MQSKRGLRPGMKVRNVRSGNIGEVRADPEHPQDLYSAADFCVAVRVKGPNEYHYPFWRLWNIEIVEE